MENSYDVVIIGAGPAGLTAGLYAARSGLKTAIVSKSIGGTANSIKLIETWPGFRGSGSELMKMFYSQIKKFDIDFIMEEASKIERTGKDFSVGTRDKKIQGKTLIIATGKERKKLGIPGEEELTGRGVSYCATCDAFFFKGKTVVLVSDSELPEDEKILSNLVKKIYHVGSKELKEIIGKEKVEKIIVEENGKRKEINVDAVFIELGGASLTEFVKKLNVKLDKDGYIIVNDEMKTSAPGIFASGDITNFKLRQVLTASSHGAIAAKSASEFLKK
jgi:thioredoxin reductase (NADPH)